MRPHPQLSARRACASRRSARASVAAVGPMPQAGGCDRLHADRFWKLATLTPLKARAAPPVGNTWLVPLQ